MSPSAPPLRKADPVLLRDLVTAATDQNATLSGFFIGAVLGLMAVMQNLADPSKLGHGIAAAFTATIYGIGLANLVFLPMASKLKSTIAAQTHVREMIIEGMIGIAQGENPRAIESRLQSFMHS